MEEFIVKEGAGIVSHDQRDYGPGEIIEMSVDAAAQIAHAVDPRPVEVIKKRSKERSHDEGPSLDV